MAEARAVVESLESAVRPLETEASLSWWESAVDANPDTEKRRAAAEFALSDHLADADGFTAVRDAVRDPADPFTARSLDILEQSMMPHQVDGGLRHRIIEIQTSIESTFASHRGEIDAQQVDDNEIIRVLRTSDDSNERRSAWEASKTVGAAVASDIRELARLRNEAARALGARDHFALSLSTQELDEGRLFETLSMVDAATAAPFREWKAALDARLADRFGCDVDTLAPWHYDDPFFQHPPIAAAVDLDEHFEGTDLEELTNRTFDAIGLDIDPIIERSDLYPRAHKNQHAFCIDIDRDGDVRVLCNVVPNEQWAETMLHEFGHAVYFAEVDHSLPWLLRTMHALTTEGVAMLFGRLSQEPAWLREVAGLPGAEVEALAPRLAAATRASLLVFARWVLVMTNFERGLYANPDDDHDTRWWELVEHYQLVRAPEGRRAPDWAAKIHVAVTPVYYQNYLYGELFASQLAATVAGSSDAIVGDRDVGNRLVERVFRPGAVERWDRLVESATGTALSPAAFAGDLARSP
jgi:peptidyl-dipeptidase A